MVNIFWEKFREKFRFVEFLNFYELFYIIGATRVWIKNLFKTKLRLTRLN